MNDNIKTWMIEAGDVLDVMPPDKKQTATLATSRPLVAESRPLPKATPVETVKRRPKAPLPQRSRMHFALLIALTYLLGPLAILLTPRGRRQQSALVLAGLSVMATVALVWAGFSGLVHPEHPATVWAWLALLTIAVGAGFTAWARAVHLLAGEGLPRVNQLPYWLRRKWSVSVLGLVAPGSGMLLGGQTGRAALTLWLLGPAVAAGVILLNVMGLWRHHLATGWLGSSGPALETAIMVAAAVAALGFLGYIAQALQGVRQVLVEPGLQTRVKGDYYALAVIAAVVVVAVAVNPVQMARQIDVGGDILQAEGFQAIPLQMTLLARRLDPGQPEYALQAVELYRELGDQEQAATVRSELDRSLGTYVAMVEKETVAKFALAQAAAVTKTRPRPADIKPAESRETAVNLDPSWAMGALVARQKSAVNQDSVQVIAPLAVSRTLGMPFGPGLTAGETTPQPAVRLGPGK